MLWGIRPVEQSSAYGLVAAGLRRQIHLGLVLPGDRLPTERQLAEELEVARMTLRQALQVLAAEGYLSIRRGANGGIFVVSETELNAVALRHLTRDPGGVMRLMEFRAANESLAARLSARRRTAAQLAQMRSAATSLRLAVTAGEMRRAESLFLIAMVEASGNDLLIEAIEHAAALLLLPFEADVAAAVQASAAVREALLQAIRQRDGGAAEEQARLLFELAYQRLRVVAGPAFTRVS